MDRSKTQDGTAAPIEHPESSESIVADTTRSLSPMAADAFNLFRGFCMGAADSVPGVSGGTVALILGHYQRLVTVISRFDMELIGLLREGRWRSAASHIDLRFTAVLGLGLLSGFVALSGIMHSLLEHRMSETLAVFFGLLIASLWVVQRWVDRWSASRWVVFGIGATVAVVITLLPMASGSSSLPFLFVSAALAICAMILPGISGAFVLLLLGVYHPVIGLVKDFVRLQLAAEGWVQLIVFGSGLVVGLLSFTRLLRWMLDRYQGLTMAALMGLMVGCLGKLWPLQVPTAETAHLEFDYRVMQYVSPANYEGNVGTLVALAVVSAAVVSVAEWWANRPSQSDARE